MRALKVVIVLALGALAGSCDAESAPAEAASKPPITCCKLGAPSCNCTVIGTRPGGGCESVCDAAPVNWRTETDENGCPRYVIGSQSCLSRPPSTPVETRSAAVGTPCRSEDDCPEYCSNDPTPVCVESLCSNHGTPCNGGNGVCYGPFGLGKSCLPRCTFGNAGSAPVGCAGKNACHVASIDPFETSGIGACYGGCIVDADCPSPTRCLREFGICFEGTLELSKPVGEPCTKADYASGKPTCACELGASGAGYCSRACRVSTDAECPTGFECDAMLPPGFAAVPTDIAGWCNKTCTSDADCTALNSNCVAAAGLSVKVCRPN